MTAINPALSAIDVARYNAHLQVDKIFDELVISISKPSSTDENFMGFKYPSDADCIDPSNKVGKNLSPRGVELLFRLLDHGAGYNSAARKFSITQTAVKNQKRNWEKAGGKNRTLTFIPDFDPRA